MYFSLPLTRLPPERLGLLRRLLLIVFIATIAWFVAKKLHFLEEFLFERFLAGGQDAKTRRERTQLQIVRRLTAAIIVLAAIGAILSIFNPVRRIGISLLASAGLVGLVLSIAAQPTLAATVAGTQLAFADSLRLDDVVVVEGEWGRIEKLNLTHVVLRMWDGRRLILPSTYFTSKPYQNWTRYETRVLGTVELPVDFTADMDALRTEAQRLVQATPLWDRKEWQLQVIDVTDQGLAKIRITASAADGPSAWDLRCEVREGMLRFLRDEHPQWLPRRPSYES
jgi:small-conductance mechanosensitive channel